MSSEREQIIDLTNQLVRIPSRVIEPEEWQMLLDESNKAKGEKIISKKKDYAVQVLDAVNEYIGSSDVVSSQTFENHGVVSRLWGNKETMLNPKLLLNGHIDVVDAPDNYFISNERDGKMFGRGTGDMKGHVAAMVTAYKKWLVENGSSKNVGLLLTSDEELGGFKGSRYVVEKGLLRPATVFIPDGSYSFDIVDSQKAPHHFHIRAKSSTGGGHVSRAFEKDNPIARILNVYAEMKGKYALASKKDEWKSTLEMTVFKTGNGATGINKENGTTSIPEWAEAWLGWRWPLEIPIDGKQETYESGTKYLQKIVEKHGVEILPDGHGFGEGCYTDPKADFVQKWKVTIEQVLGREVGFRHMHGATDGRHFYKYGANVLVTSAITGGEHSDNEWVDIDSLVKLSEAIYRYQKEMSK